MMQAVLAVKTALKSIFIRLQEQRREAIVSTTPLENSSSDV
jgi:hypothetical protein